MPPTSVAARRSMSVPAEKPKETPLRKVLVAIVGLSPQVVTETLWALRRERGFVPNEIRVILTRAARVCVVHDLLDPLEGRFHAFCRDYGLVGRIRFDESCVTVVTDADGVLTVHDKGPNNATYSAVVEILLKDGRKDRKVIPQCSPNQLGSETIVYSSLVGKPLTWAVMLDDELGDYYVDYIDSTETEAAEG